MARLLALLFAASLVTPALALAQNEPTPPPADSDEEDEPNIRYKARTEIDFEARRLEAGLATPYGTLISGLPEREKTPLLTLKADFNEEMKRSADSIR